MNPIDALTEISEFSIGLAGFTAIIATFSGSEKVARASLEFRVRNLLLISFTPGFISLFEVALMNSGLDVAAAIVVGSGILGVFLIGLIYRAVKSYLTMTGDERRQLSSFLWWFTLILGGINIAAQFANVLFGPLYESSILLAGLVATLLIAAMTFFVLVIQILKGAI